ncbi:MAG: 4'-phosphopantetheinyl transferase superfamily protein [Chlorobiaceae bacterium]|nr:4'-phosphopantetheinyl transferase superfamily protein [Chlorobiaceae bacterium]
MIISNEGVTAIHTDVQAIGIPAEELSALLSDDERTRAGSFRFETDRMRFIIRRGLLRRMLGAALGVQPAMIRFSATEVGKPFIAWPEQPGLHFNLSHSGDQIVYAFSRHPETGIDIERIRTVDGIDRLARNYFSAEEYALVINLPAWEKNKAFIKLWCIKEALIKASGWTLEHGLTAFDVAAQYRMNRFRVPFGDTRTLTCITPVFEHICGYATTLAIRLDEGEALRLHRYTFQSGEAVRL